MCLEPRSVIATPSLQRGHSSGLYVGTSRLSNACTFSFGTPNSALPPERLTRRPTPTISPPDWLTTLTTSCTEPPVVTISYTISTRVPGSILNPRRNVITPFSRSVKIARVPNSLPTS